MLNIAIANLKKILKDYRAIIGILIAPVLIMFFFSFLSSPDKMSIKVGVAYESESREGDYVQEYLKSRGIFQIQYFDRAELKEKIKSKKISAGMVINEGFELLKSDENSYMILKSDVEAALKKIDLIGNENLGENAASSVIYRDNYKPNKKVFVIGFIINFMMFSMVYMINELGDLKRSNVLRRSCTCSHSNFELLGGLLLSLFAIVFMQYILVNLMGLFLFKELLFTNIIWATIVFIPFILLILGLGLLISRNTKNADLSPIIVNITVIPLGLVSGTFFPSEMLPEFLQKFGFLAPQYWVVRGIEVGQSFSVIITSIVVLSIMALCVLAGSSYNFKSYLKN